jgi:bifunctional non-homologous end joining protein LigD
VQKHAARRLHYDFRLELRGVLKSWAVPRGPSLDPGVKRLAIEVEDHPLEYADFEGVIPDGQYGAGVVLIWDRGTWIPQGDPLKSYQRGTLEFELRAERLRGGWVLVRMNRGTRQRNWLLIKERDAEARPGSDDAVVVQYQTSIITGRDLEAVNAAQDRVLR